jgi:hypothetical protein
MAGHDLGRTWFHAAAQDDQCARFVYQLAEIRRLAI